MNSRITRGVAAQDGDTQVMKRLSLGTSVTLAVTRETWRLGQDEAFVGHAVWNAKTTFGGAHSIGLQVQEDGNSAAVSFGATGRVGLVTACIRTSKGRVLMHSVAVECVPHGDCAETATR